ncbi:hypothetical protein C0J52_08089 [Blattella germanica]|nr:hypothetical protein C0J52_08089 [Blattella germanica]
MDYLEQQDAPLTDKLVLRKNRSVINKRQATSLKQKSIQDYFTVTSTLVSNYFQITVCILMWHMF